MTHSPAPWHIENHKIRTSAGYSVADIHGSKTTEGAANATLIAAAPELLDALCDCLPFIEEVEHDPLYKKGYVTKLLKKIRAVTEKAEGSKP